MAEITVDRRATTRGLLAVYVAAFGFVVWQFGVPLQRAQVLAWLLVGCALVVFARGESAGAVGRTARDWLLLGGLFVAYDYSRAAADTLGMPIQVDMPIVVDKALFGGLVPTVELQQRLGPFDGGRWWEAAISIVYMSHFVVPYIATAWWWLRERRVWKSWLAQFGILTSMGLVSYILVPTTPPWLAAEDGKLPALVRTARLGWRSLGLESAEDLVKKGQNASNLVAAFPSLHSAYPALLAIVVWPRVGRVGKALAVVYPFAMAFTLVISAEHYVTDVLAGWAFAAIAALVWWRLAQVPRVAVWLDGTHVEDAVEDAAEGAADDHAGVRASGLPR